MIDNVKVYMGNRELAREDFQKYICISTEVSDIVNNVYNRSKRMKRQ